MGLSWQIFSFRGALSPSAKRYGAPPNLDHLNFLQGSQFNAGVSGLVPLPFRWSKACHPNSNDALGSGPQGTLLTPQFMIFHSFGGLGE